MSAVSNISGIIYFIFVLKPSYPLSNTEYTNAPIKDMPRQTGWVNARAYPIVNIKYTRLTIG
jgi:hypothetical protein